MADVDRNADLPAWLERPFPNEYRADQYRLAITGAAYAMAAALDLLDIDIRGVLDVALLSTLAEPATLATNGSVLFNRKATFWHAYEVAQELLESEPDEHERAIRDLWVDDALLAPAVERAC